ncbi:MAG: folylpolyglutamate synthase/dihydrofolate synthase family protein [Alphaproteobacteria bacterium]|nr:folylpolyglutamate synthase/dihydrofolate synthase family protein [Alphaproteobacteria bacterium]
MALTSTSILSRFRRGGPGGIDLTLRPAYRDRRAKLGDPHTKIPPVFHVAGTNGKGSVCAFLRAILEAAGYKVHVYTSPHLVTFHERIRIAGNLISEDELVAILNECERLAAPGSITYFEAATAAAFAAFARHRADFTILETGLGGRLDATNIIEKPLATLITRLSCDHREYLGNTLADLAREKAGIMRAGVPCFTIPQPDGESLETLRTCATAIGALLHIVDPVKFPGVILALSGKHQWENANLAVAALDALPSPLPANAITHGLQNAEWPARLQKLDSGALRDLLPTNWELWLDGGHNDSAGEVLAAQARAWQSENPALPLHLIIGMITTKNPAEFLAPLAPYITSLHSIAIPGEAQSFTAEALAQQARDLKIPHVTAAENIQQALARLANEKSPSRILIGGSLYLAGDVLRLNQA